MLRVRAVHTFVAEHGDELEFQAGEEIEVLERDEAFGDGWWRGRNTKGEEGLFPATYISQDPPTPEDKSIGTAISSGRVSPTAKAESIKESEPITNSNHLSAPAVPPPEESPRGTTQIESSGGILDTAVSTVEAAAVTVGNVMGKTLGDIQNAIESIAQPESDDDHDHDDGELGIGTNTRAKLAEQARRANEHREKNRDSSGVAGLVYSDESEDEEEENRRSLPATAALASPTLPNGNANGSAFHASPALLDQPILAKTPSPAPPLAPTSGLETSTGSLEPALNLPSTPTAERSSQRSSAIPAKPPSTWSIDDVVSWGKAKGFDDVICEKFQEHEITGDLLLELDANLLKELDIPQFGKRMRIAAAISELRRPSSVVSGSSQQFSPGGGLPTGISNSSSMRGMSAPPTAFGQPFPSITPPLSTPPMSGNTEDHLPHSVWAHSRKSSGPIPPAMAPINENQAPTNENQAPTPPPINNASSTAVSMPASPVTPSSVVVKRESTGSMGHKRGKPSLDNKERLSFFGRSRKPAPASSVSPSSEQQRSGSRLGFSSSNRVHQMQPATPDNAKRLSGTNGTGSAAALQQIGKPDHSGYMKKKGERYGWKTRFFVLKGSHLYYLRSETEDRVKGHIDLKGHRVIVDENTNPGSYGFRVVGSDKTHFFSSLEQAIVREWMKALMKATIARDFSVPVTSSCNIPTIPLAEAQAMAPRPPSPATREATQRATRRDNPNQLTAHDASVLMSLDTTSGEKRRASQLNVSTPNRPSKDLRRPSSNFSARPQSIGSGSAFPVESQPINKSTSNNNKSTNNTELVQWVNSHLPLQYPRATSLPQSFVSGEVIFLLVKHLSNVEPSPPVPPHSFTPELDGLPGLSGLFAMMDILIDAGVDTAGVSINDVRTGDEEALENLLGNIRIWTERSNGTGLGYAQ